MSKLKLIIALMAATWLSACAQWKTEYPDDIDALEARTWTFAEINVSVPEALTVSEANSYLPDADIVWREDPPGDRREQVARILSDAAQRATSQFEGERKVALNIEVTRFHALTEKARINLSFSGVHNIRFKAQIIDLETNNQISSVADIRADLPAYSGQRALEAVARGETQRVRIVRHVSDVLKAWLGAGPDARGGFTRLGG